jgi:hypothetical protein
MYKTTTLRWPAANTTYVAALQNGVASVPLTLNSANYNTVTGLMDFPGFYRYITLTSANNLSGVNFVIKGKDNYDNLIQETLAGPNNTTVTSVNQYYNIISITPSATANGVSAGSGVQGYCVPYTFNYAGVTSKNGSGYTFTSLGTNNVNIFLSRQVMRVPGQQLTIADFRSGNTGAAATTTSTSVSIVPYSSMYLQVNSGNSAGFILDIYDNY